MKIASWGASQRTVLKLGVLTMLAELITAFFVQDRSVSKMGDYFKVTGILSLCVFVATLILNQPEEGIQDGPLSLSSLKFGFVALMMPFMYVFATSNHVTWLQGILSLPSLIVSGLVAFRIAHRPLKVSKEEAMNRYIPPAGQVDVNGNWD